MKKVLFSVLALLMGVSAFAQINFLDDFEGYESTPASDFWYGAAGPADEQSLGGWYIDDLSEYGILARSGAYSAWSLLSDADEYAHQMYMPGNQFNIGEGIRIKFYYRAVNPNNDEIDTALMYIYCLVDGVAIDFNTDAPLYSESVPADGEWKCIYLDLDQIAGLYGLSDGEHTLEFLAVHVTTTGGTAQENATVLQIDDFSYRTGDYSMVYFDNYGLMGSMDIMSTTTGNVVTLPTCTYTSTDGVFGCYFDMDGNLYYPGQKITLSSDMFLMSYFGPAVTLSYNSNGGNGSMTSQNVCANYGILVVPQCSFTKPGCTFSSWNTKADGTGVSAQPGDTAQFDEDETLFAIWNCSGFESIDKVGLENVTLYPNPAKDVVSVVGMDVDQVKVIDVVGRTVNVIDNSNVVDLSGLKSGVYMLRISAGDNSVIRRVVKR